MLRAIRLEDYRSFADSGRIELGDLNVFIGANSAGKSNLMRVIHLALANEARPSRTAPLDLSSQPSFSSFDSVVRQVVGRRAPRPEQFRLTLERGLTEDPSFRSVRVFTFGRDPQNHAAVVSRVDYPGFQSSEVAGLLQISRIATGEHAGRYQIVAPPNLQSLLVGEGFDDGVPREVIDEMFSLIETPSLDNLAVIAPNRPVPRSLYVLDDPGMSTEDRELITELLQLWGSQRDAGAREHIAENLATLGLASNIEVRTVNPRKRGPQVAQVRIAPKTRRQVMTLADVGYGVSQVLPLLTREARLTEGALLAYQPEVHLHPLSQARLADVFVASVQRGNRVYVETHSEHLVLRLQTLVASGRIAPGRVRVFCVEHDGELSHVRPMSFDERGVPNPRWPKGFLDTDLTLADDLVAARQGRSAPPAARPGRKR